MLSFAAFVPSHPILIPSVGGEHCSTLNTTRFALKAIQKKLEATKTESIVLLVYPKKPFDAFGMQFTQQMKGNLKDFGDFSTEVVFPCDYVLGYALKESVHAIFPIHGGGNANLPYTATVPLLLLCIPNTCPIFVIDVASGSLAHHLAFGKALYRPIAQSAQRIAVIAVGDLSHTEGSKTSQDIDTKAEQFDRTIVQLIQEHNTTILAGQEQLSLQVHETGLKSLAILMGIVENVHTTPSVLSYERPLGVGHIVVHFPV